MKSFIERAIELAKLQRQQSGDSDDHGDDHRIAPNAHNKSRRRRIQVAAVAPPPMPDVNFAPIDLAKAPMIVTDSDILRQNRILVDSDIRQPAENAYRMLRTRVMRQMRNNSWTKLGITAAGANEGKTLTAINLALSIAAERVQPVVLVDLDLRRPRVNRYLGIEESRFVDLSDYLEGRTNSIQQLVVNVGDQGLSCILCARAIDRSSDLLASPLGQSFLSQLSHAFPSALMICDLPPFLSTDDPMVVAPSMDAFLLVVAEGTSPRHEVANVAKALGEFNMLGVVLNKSAERSDPGYYAY